MTPRVIDVVLSKAACTGLTLFPVLGPSGTSSSSGFKSPNVVAPATSSVMPPSPAPRSFAGPSPFPFTSMTHAAQTQHARLDHPAASPSPITSSVASPLLVNLLQTEGKDGKDAGVKMKPKPVGKVAPPRVSSPRFPIPPQRLPTVSSPSIISNSVPRPVSSLVVQPPAKAMPAPAPLSRTVLQGYSQFTGKFSNAAKLGP